MQQTPTLFDHLDATDSADVAPLVPLRFGVPIAHPSIHQHAHELPVTVILLLPLHCRADTEPVTPTLFHFWSLLGRGRTETTHYGFENTTRHTGLQRVRLKVGGHQRKHVMMRRAGRRARTESAMP